MLSKLSKQTPIWLTTVLISIIAVLFLIYFPFQISLFPENVVKKVYYVDNISPAHQKIIRKFNEAYKGKIEVVPVNLPFQYFTTNDRKEILTRSLRSRSDGIDIYAVDIIWIPRFAKWGYPMNSLFDRRTLDNVNDMALQACYHKDSLVAFPLFLDVGVLYYRKDLIRSLPDGAALERKIRSSLTWDEFLALGRRLRPAHRPFYVFAGGNFEGMLCCFHELLSDEESSAIFSRNPVNLDVAPARKALQFMVDLIHANGLSPSTVTRFDEYKSYVYANDSDAVFLRGWVGYQKQYNRLLRDSSNASNLEIAPLPHFAGSTTSGVFGGWSLMVSKFSESKAEALQFIDFMFRKENQEILYEDGGYLPINTEVYSDSLYLLEHKELARIRDLLSWGKHRPELEHYTRMSEIMARYFHKALMQEITVREALGQASRHIDDAKREVEQTGDVFP